MYNWSSRGGEISNIVSTYIRKMTALKVKNSAKDKVSAMQEQELKARVLKAMDEFPELYKYFV